MYEDSLLDFLYTNRISYERMVFVNPKFHVNRVPGPCNAGTSSWVDHLTTSAQVNVPIFRQQLSYSFRSHICCKKAIHYTEGTCSYFQTAALVQLPLSHLLQKGNPLHRRYMFLFSDSSSRTASALTSAAKRQSITHKVCIPPYTPTPTPNPPLR